jgi:RNA polymerase sigma-70 factor (ECF subfamily)
MSIIRNHSFKIFRRKSIKEIAEELGISVANTKVQVMRAKKS